jgi:DNA repair photolyase
VRWSNLSIDEEERARLPGYREEAVVRHFEAPDAISTRFYEVRAKSILNRVPEASQMPFRWTINVYRGCTHACAYCMSGDTNVLMADGRPAPLRDLRVGDEIYGTSRDGVHRRFRTTTVLDKWSSLQWAYLVNLEDGTELVASDRHRFLTERGWKHVIGADHGPLKRPHLTVGIKLLGLAGNVDPPAKDADYRRGYLCGVIRGDGGLRRHERIRRDGRSYMAHSFHLVLNDFEALTRANSYLEHFRVLTHMGTHQQASGNHRATAVVRTSTAANHQKINDLIAWPLAPSMSWRKGFLAGIFDAEGCWSHGTLSISNGDRLILDWTRACLDVLGFDHALHDQRKRGKDGAAQIRVRGGLPEHMRFLLSTDPAITRKRSIAERRLWTSAPLRVTSIRPLGKVMRMYDITTGTGDFIANGVVSHNCFARPTHTYLDFNAGEDFERQIIVKVNAPERLRVELARPSWKGEHIALGTNTDPYQWVEGRYKLMPGIWQAMIDARNPGSVLTKSPLLLRDLELMKQLNERAGFGAALSVPTIDEKAWRATEPHTPNPRARLEAVAELTRAGIRTGILVAPLMPGINDDPRQVEKILEMATEAGAAYVTGIALHLRGEVRGLFMDWLAEHRPDLLDRYRALYRKGAYMPPLERRRLAELVKGPDLAPSERGRAGYTRAARPVSPTPAPVQESLFDAGMLGGTSGAQTR